MGKSKKNNSTNSIEITELFKKIDIFSSLNKEELKIIASNSRFYKYKKGEKIFTEGSLGDQLYVISQGKIKITKTGPGNKEEIMARFIPGESFGELNFFCDNPNDVSAVSEKDSVILMFPNKKTSFSQILEEHPKISARMLHKFIAAIAGRIRNANNLLKENSTWVQQLRRQMYTDKLTGLMNKTFLEENYKEFVKRGKISILMIKPDNFKQINDTFGHEAGDLTIKQMAHTLKEVIKSKGIVIRYMGNEFAAVLPGASLESAYARAKNIQKCLNSIPLDKATGKSEFNLTISIGIMNCPKHSKKPMDLMEIGHALALSGRDKGGNKLLMP